MQNVFEDFSARCLKALLQLEEDETLEILSLCEISIKCRKDYRDWST